MCCKKIRSCQLVVVQGWSGRFCSRQREHALETPTAPQLAHALCCVDTKCTKKCMAINCKRVSLSSIGPLSGFAAHLLMPCSLNSSDRPAFNCSSAPLMRGSRISAFLPVLCMHNAVGVGRESTSCAVSCTLSCNLNQTNYRARGGEKHWQRLSW